MNRRYRKTIIAGNWKMNKTPAEAKALIEEMKPLLSKTKWCEMVLCVPFTDIQAAVKAAKGSKIAIGAENMHFEKSGAFTGEISADMLKELGVKYVIIGHSERRQYFNETDEACGTKYHENFLKFLTRVQDEDLAVDGAMTDVKGDRSLAPSKQADPDLFTHVVEKREDGVIICGAKAHMTGMANSHEMLILPTTNLLDGDQDYAIACAVPVDAEGITHIFGRQTNDQRRLQGDLDTGNSEYAIVGGETLTVLDHVFVPWDRVFMCGEVDFAQDYVARFAAYHRQNYGGCKVGNSDVLIGATSMIAKMNGTRKNSLIKDKLTEMIHLAETMYCCSLACSYEGVKEEAGSYYVNTLLANEVKLNCTRNMYEISRLAHDIAGGFIATLPHEWDLNNPETGKWIEKFFVGNEEYTARDRIKIARLLENMSGGTALAESMHGAGSPQAMKVMILRESNVEQKEQFAMDLAHVKL